MMLVGDPSDMRPFIGRQEDGAFSDLVWVAVLHAFPQAVLQLHLLLFPGGAALLRGDWPDYTDSDSEDEEFDDVVTVLALKLTDTTQQNSEVL
ncbi:hypothetical protein HPB50_001151 [Hyalomma asiaticum]|uniref:Uncharacterized protein n=1 Tax=Hyalomma asiaticum TaxID=266040 RepID=A0ACB7TAY8_HYAAI|nr:hypothetical protein HPB50_001151 [Hyalomma asiaticum]